jgi:glucose/mannose-6-phosphate isomerase
MTIEKMQSYLYDLPEQFNEMLRLRIELPDRYKKDYRNIVVSGLGGSAIGGDILRSYALGRSGCRCLSIVTMCCRLL